MRATNGSTTRKRRKAMKERVEQTYIQSNEYAYRDRKNKKRDFRKLWIARINAACRPLGISYSRLMNGLKKQKISINRKMLSELAINQPKEFEKLVKQVQSANKK